MRATSTVATITEDRPDHRPVWMAAVVALSLLVGVVASAPAVGAHKDDGDGNTHLSDGSCHAHGLHIYPCPGHATANYIHTTYRLFLRRSATQSELSRWAPMIEAGNRAALTRSLSVSEAWAGVEIRNLYKKILDRKPDPGGFKYWLGRVRHGGLIEEMAAHFYGSSEYFGRAGSTNRGFVDRLYWDLLGRGPDSGGLRYWVGRLNAGMSRTQVASGFYASMESRRSRVTRLYRVILSRAPDAGGLAYWSDRITILGDVSLASHLAASREFYNRSATNAPPSSNHSLVLRTVEGDIIDVQRQSGVTARVRLIGIDAPDRGECGFAQARDGQAGLVNGRWAIEARGPRDLPQGFNFVLRYVDVDGRDVGLTLIQRGLAIARYDSYDGGIAHPREDAYRAADDRSPNICG